MKIVIISDTHGMHEELDIPDGDILIHAGDFTRDGTVEEAVRFNHFLSTLPHQHKIVIAGNHDFCFERIPDLARAAMKDCIYLEDSNIVIDGIKFYGSPWQPWFFDWAFNLERGEEIRQKWQRIDEDTDILITHGPPLGHGDVVSSGDRAGCEELIRFVETIQPRYHIFGHIHESYGVTKNSHTTFINGSSCDLEYDPVNPPVCIEI